MPTGVVLPFAMETPPDGWLKCNGSPVSRTDYSDLFAAIGTRYGEGDGSTTFNLPESRADLIRGWDDGRGVDAGRELGSFQHSSHIPRDNDGYHLHCLTTVAAAIEHGFEPPTLTGISSHTWQNWAGGSDSPANNNIDLQSYTSAMMARNNAYLLCIKT